MIFFACLFYGDTQGCVQPLWRKKQDAFFRPQGGVIFVFLASLAQRLFDFSDFYLVCSPPSGRHGGKRWVKRKRDDSRRTWTNFRTLHRSSAAHLHWKVDVCEILCITFLEVRTFVLSLNYTAQNELGILGQFIVWHISYDFYCISMCMPICTHIPIIPLTCFKWCVLY